MMFQCWFLYLLTLIQVKQIYSQTIISILRCVAKYWEIHERVGKKLQKMSSQDEDALKKMAAEQGQVK